MAAVIFIAVLNDAISGELQKGHFKDMMLSSMGADVMAVMCDWVFFGCDAAGPSFLAIAAIRSSSSSYVSD